MGAKFRSYIDDMFEAYPDYEDIKLRILNIRRIMERHPSFRQLGTEDKFKQCVTILAIYIDTERDLVNRSLPIEEREPESKFPRSIIKGYENKKLRVVT